MQKSENKFAKLQLDDRVVDAVKALGYKRPTEVQEKVMPLMLQRKNLIVEAPTGSGKTAAYGLPLITRLDTLKKHTEVLVIVPGRELAIQVESALKTFSTNARLRIGAVYGGMSLEESSAVLKAEPHIVVAVPGRLKDVLRTGRHDVFWRNIKYLVIDEADKLLEPAFRAEVDQLVSNLRNNVQVALLSATISSDMEELFRERFHPLMTIRLSPKQVLRSIKFHYVDVGGGQDDRYLGGLLRQKRIQSALIFRNKREEVYATANFLRGLGYKTEAYHGLMDQVERDAVMNRFRQKQIQFLVATDLAARGIDIVDLPCVINASFPADLEVYLHRSGRTGRAGNKGAVYNLVTSKKEEILIQAFHGQIDIALAELAVEPLDKSDLRTAEKLVKIHMNRGKRDKVSRADVVGFLVNTVGCEADDIGTIALYDAYALVDVPESAVSALEGIEGLKIKGKNVRAGKYSLADQKKKADAVKKSRLGVRDKAEQVEKSEKIAEKKEQKQKKTTAKPTDKTAKPSPKPSPKPASKPAAKAKPASKPRTGAKSETGNKGRKRNG